MFTNEWKRLVVRHMPVKDIVFAVSQRVLTRIFEIIFHTTEVCRYYDYPCFPWAIFNQKWTFICKRKDDDEK